MIGEDMPHWYVTDLLSYDSDTGLFTWKMSTGSQKAGSRAGVVDKESGYVRISIDRKTYKAHRLAWFYVHKRWPAQNIDHINHDRADNRLVNLREVTQKQNTQAMKKRVNTKSKFKGITPYKYKPGFFVAQIRYDGKQRKIGIFDSELAAHEAYCAEARKRFGEYFCAG